MYNEELMKFREEKISMRVPPLIKNSNTGQAHRYRQRSLLAVERNARLNIFFMPISLISCLDVGLSQHLLYIYTQHRL